MKINYHLSGSFIKIMFIYQYFVKKKVWIGFDSKKVKEKSEQQKNLFFKVQEACAKCFAVHILEGVSSKPSGNYILGPDFCFSS